MWLRCSSIDSQPIMRYTVEEISLYCQDSPVSHRTPQVPRWSDRQTWRECLQMTLMTQSFISDIPCDEIWGDISYHSVLCLQWPDLDDFFLDTWDDLTVICLHGAPVAGISDGIFLLSISHPWSRWWSWGQPAGTPANLAGSHTQAAGLTVWMLDES